MRVTYVRSFSTLRTTTPQTSHSLVASAAVAFFRNSRKQRTVEITSFELFYQNEYHSLLGLAYVLTGNMTEAEDITQETFGEAHRNWSKIAGYEQAASWLRKVLVNKKTSRFRKLSSEKKALRALSSQPQEKLGITAASNEIWTAVRSLPPRQAQVLALRYWDDFTVQQIAETLNLGTETVKTHLSRAKIKIATVLAEKGFNENGVSTRGETQ